MRCRIPTDIELKRRAPADGTRPFRPRSRTTRLVHRLSGKMRGCSGRIREVRNGDRTRVLDLPDEGRDVLAREAASRYGQIRGRCVEDIQHLEGRIRDWLGSRK